MSYKYLNTVIQNTMDLLDETKISNSNITFLYDQLNLFNFNASTIQI